jgi:nucleoside phosphorylase
VTVGIVTALAVEFAAIRSIVDGPARVLVPNDPNHYFVGTMPSLDPQRPHSLAMALLPRDNNKNAATVCADLLRSFPSIESVIMCGVAGGIPSPATPADHVRLGDIVVGVYGVVDYDHVWRINGRDELRGHLEGMSIELTRCANELAADAHGGAGSWEERLTPDVLGEEYARPADRFDLLYRSGRAIAHPPRERSGHRPGLPKVHYAAIGSADRLVRDEAFRDELRRRYDVRAVEMEASGVATSAHLRGKHWFVVRGIVDYCEDRGKNRLWHPYAAMAAAAYVRALLAIAPPPTRAPRPLAEPSGEAVDAISEELVTVLLALPQLTDFDRRQTIVSMLPNSLRGRINARTAPREAIVEILTACLDHDHGVSLLIHALSIVVGDTRSGRQARESLEMLDHRHG